MSSPRPDLAERAPMIAVEPDAASAADVWALLREFTQEHSPRHELRRRLEPSLVRGRSKVMTLIDLARGPLSLGEIATAQKIDRPYATAIVDQLEALGMAERTADPADRRRKLVALTPAGHEAAAIASEVSARPPEPLAELGPADLATLATLLTRLLGR